MKDDPPSQINLTLPSDDDTHLLSESSFSSDKEQQPLARRRIRKCGSKLLQYLPFASYSQGQECYPGTGKGENSFKSSSLKTLVLVLTAFAFLGFYAFYHLKRVGTEVHLEYSSTPDLIDTSSFPVLSMPMIEFLPISLVGTYVEFKDQHEVTDEAEYNRRLWTELTVVARVYQPDGSQCNLTYSLVPKNLSFAGAYTFIADFDNPTTNCSRDAHVILGNYDSENSKSMDLYVSLTPWLINYVLSPFLLLTPGQFSMKESVKNPRWFWNPKEMSFLEYLLQMQYMHFQIQIEKQQTKTTNFIRSHHFFVDYESGAINQTAPFFKRNFERLTTGLIKRAKASCFFTDKNLVQKIPDSNQFPAVDSLSIGTDLNLEVQSIGPPTSIVMTRFFGITDFLSNLGGIYSIIKPLLAIFIGFYLFSEFNRHMAHRIYEKEHPSEAEQVGSSSAKKAELSKIQEDFRGKVTQEAIFRAHEKASAALVDLKDLKERREAREVVLDSEIAALRNRKLSLQAELLGSLEQIKKSQEAYLEELEAVNSSKLKEADSLKQAVQAAKKELVLLRKEMRKA